MIARSFEEGLAAEANDISIGGNIVGAVASETTAAGASSKNTVTARATGARGAAGILGAGACSLGDYPDAANAIHILPDAAAAGGNDERISFRGHDEAAAASTDVSTARGTLLTH